MSVVCKLWPSLVLWVSCQGQDIRRVSLPNKGADGAYETCPCLSVSAALHNNFLALGSNIPQTYGSSCQAWDANGTGWSKCRVPKPPNYCALKWCYVGVNCGLPHSVSEGLSGVNYSYSTCGSINFLDLASELDASRMFKNGMISSGLKPSADTTTAGTATLLYAHELLGDLGINPDLQIVHQNISMDATEVMGTGSTYTRCVYDVALGLLDFCLYDFWLTHTRINTGTTPIAVFSDTFVLFVEVPTGEESFGEKLEKPFLPFSWGLWGLCVAVVAAYGLLLGLFQADHDAGEDQLRDIRTFWNLLEHTYLSFLGFFSAGVIEDANELKPASKILTLGFAFFVLIAIASFTGSTASFLMQQNNKLVISSIEGAISANVKICYPEEIEGALKPKYPALTKLGVSFPWSSTRTIFDEIRDGKCKVAVASYTYSISAESVCGFKETGNVVHSVSVGFFVSRELGLKFLYHDAKLHQLGIWGRLENEVNRPYPCPEKVKKDVELQQLEATHMMGNCFVMIASALLALVVHCMYKGSKIAKQNSGVLKQAWSSSAVVLSPRGGSAKFEDSPVEP